MTAVEAYILAKKVAISAVSGIDKVTFDDTTSRIVFHFKDGTESGLYIPVPEDGKDGQDGRDGRDGKDGLNGKDGLSIQTVEIDDNGHLVCTMSDGTAIDAGKIPGETVNSGGLVIVGDKNSLPETGDETVLYLTSSDDVLYYWDIKSKKYRAVAGGNSCSGDCLGNVSFVTKEEIDEMFKNMPQVEPGENCGCVSDASFATKEDIDELFKNEPEEEPGNSGSCGCGNASLATKEDIDEMFKNMPEIEPGEGGNLGLATEEDIDKLFDGIINGDIELEDVYANKEDIDKLFGEMLPGAGLDPDIVRLATKLDIDNLFKQGGGE